MTFKFGFVTSEEHEVPVVVVGPYETRDEAAADAKGHRIVEWAHESGDPMEPCPECGATYERLPMNEDTAKVYDALFPHVLDWAEDDDCGMAQLMYDVAETAAAALRSGD